MTVDKRQLLKPRLAETEIDVPGLGEIRVRVLSRAEVIDHLLMVDRSVPGAFETRLLSLSLVDPTLTEKEVAQWRKAAPAEEIDDVVAKINELSALNDQAAKDAYKEFESNPDSEFRVLPGGEAGDDGGSTP